MKIGMLWFNNDPKMPFADKVKGAVEYYSKKYGEAATLVFVHPHMTQGETKVGEVAVKTNRSVLPNHFWVGHE